MANKAKYPHDTSRPEPVAVKRAIEAGDMEALKVALTARQRRFAEEYILDYNGAAAAVRAGYSSQNAHKQAYALTHHKGVIAYIDHLTRSKESKIVSVDPDYLIQQVVSVITKENVRDGDKLRALELLMKHKGMFIERQEITGKDGGPIQNQIVEEEAQNFTNILKSLRPKAEQDNVIDFKKSG